MPLGTLDRDPPPFFRQGPSALSKLAVCSALALFLMVADARFKVMQPMRVVLATALYPVQWLAMRPLLLVDAAQSNLKSLTAKESNFEVLRKQLSVQSQRANLTEQLLLENRRLRDLLALQQVQVIICDQRMPAMNGTEFLSKVKEMYPDTIRIILSGYTGLESVLDSINRGAIYRFYTKPWDDAELRENIRLAFRHYWLINRPGSAREG